MKLLRENKFKEQDESSEENIIQTIDTEFINTQQLIKPFIRNIIILFILLIIYNISILMLYVIFHNKLIHAFEFIEKFDDINLYIYDGVNMVQTDISTNQTDFSGIRNASSDFISNMLILKRNINYPLYMNNINEVQNIACDMLFNLNDPINPSINNYSSYIEKICNENDFMKEKKLEILFEEIYYNIENSVNRFMNTKNEYDKLMMMNNGIDFKYIFIITLFILRPILNFVSVIAEDMISNIFNFFIQFNVLTQICNIIVNLILLNMIKRIVGTNLQQITYIKCLEISLTY
jgi:hypothetical protein